MTMGTTGANGLDGAVAALEPIVRDHAAAAERDRRLSDPVARALAGAGLFKLFVPQPLGGLGASLADDLAVVERVARVDSAAGWNLQILAVGGAAIGPLLPEAGAREVLGDSGAIIAGGFNPPGTATRVDGGYRLSGRRPFMSGCQQATWFMNTGLVMTPQGPEAGPDGTPALRVFLYPATDGRVLETWDPLGMRGTGSHDVVADGVFVPEHRSGVMRPIAAPGAPFDGPFFRFGL